MGTKLGWLIMFITVLTILAVVNLNSPITPSFTNPESCGERGDVLITDLAQPTARILRVAFQNRGSEDIFSAFLTFSDETVQKDEQAVTVGKNQFAMLVIRIPQDKVVRSLTVRGSRCKGQDFALVQ